MSHPTDVVETSASLHFDEMASSSSSMPYPVSSLHEDIALVAGNSSLPMCPCTPHRRRLNDSSNDDDEVGDGETWEIAFTTVVLFFMFLALVSDRMGADSVMITALTAFLASTIISVEEGLEGFANEGLLTVMVLFVVAEGIGKTGALDWYMQKLLGLPTSAASAQLRLMIPIAVVSAFLNNTPVVAVMIPIVQKWAKNIRQSPQQLLIPLSFASILGGTCTLIGTSTNLVVVGLLDERYPDDDEISIGLFDLGQFGVPIAMAGVAYIIIASPFLLPGGAGRQNKSGQNAIDATGEAEDLLLGARLTPWSPAVNRTVQRSGLRDTGGIYLVSVDRAATGNMHRAVSKDFVLNAGDILYFTGHNVELFGEFCAEHGLEVLTNELQDADAEDAEQSAVEGPQKPDDGIPMSIFTANQSQNAATQTSSDPVVDVDDGRDDADGDLKLLVGESGEVSTTPGEVIVNAVELETIQEDDDDDIVDPVHIGCTKESLLQADFDERSRNINRMTDLIRNAHSSKSKRSLVLPERSASKEDPPSTVGKVNKAGGIGSALPPIVPLVGTGLPPKTLAKPKRQRQMTVDGLHGADPAKIVVTVEKDLVVVGINAHDRAGLLLDISKGLLRLNLQLHHTEAAVILDRSVSIWRCQIIGTELPDIEEIWSVLNALLSTDAGVEAMKQRGLRVIRGKVIKGSRLVGKTATEVHFRQLYKAAIVALRQGTHNVTTNLSTVRFQVGDVLILQASDDSPLLSAPPENFYKDLEEELARNEQGGMGSRSSSVQSLVNLIRRKSSGNLDTLSLEGEDQSSHGTAPTSKAQQHEVQSADENEIVFFVGEEDDEKGDEEKGNHSLEASMRRHEDQDRVWKDMLVVFKEVGADGVSKEFLTAMAVAPGSKFAGKTVAQAGIQKLPDLFLVSIERPVDDDGTDQNPEQQQNRNPKQKILSILKPYGNQKTEEEDPSAAENDSVSLARTEQVTFEAIDPDQPLREGDVLWFSGSASAVGDLRKIPGLIQYQSGEVEKINDRVHDRRLVQAVIARNGPLVGKTVKEIRFRTRYGAAVIAVHREGRRVHEHPGRVKLQAGDVLLLEAGPSFIGKTAENDRAFALLAEVKNSAPPRLELLVPALIIALTMLIVFTAGVTSLLICALCASVCMVALGILSEQEARDSLKWDIYVTIGSAFGIGTALVNSGVAGGIANFLVRVGEGVGIGDAGLLGSVYFATFLISNVVTNNAAAALLFPIAMDAAEQTGVDRILMSYALMLGASASFMVSKRGPSCFCCCCLFRISRFLPPVPVWIHYKSFDLRPWRIQVQRFLDLWYSHAACSVDSFHRLSHPRAMVH
mmetsp:Transcript_13946/g.31658  ORF Transcript_13946/g.31658 Transcript_13946/m.31658 type:complete len:1331 (-) Transcript_13946:148-4140(-)